MIDIDRFELMTDARGPGAGAWDGHMVFSKHPTGSWVPAVDAIAQLTAKDERIRGLEVRLERADVLARSVMKHSIENECGFCKWCAKRYSNLRVAKAGD